MNKREADTILLACKKHRLPLTMRKEGDVYLVTFNNRIEFRSFEAAKHITNGLVVEGRVKQKTMKHLRGSESITTIKISNYSKRKTRKDDGISLSERRRLW